MARATASSSPSQDNVYSDSGVSRASVLCWRPHDQFSAFRTAAMRTARQTYRSLLATAVVGVGLASVPAARAEEIACTIDRGNLCFPSRCNNTAKSERMVLDLTGNIFRFCPSRYTDRDCVEDAMQFSVSDTIITGISAGTRMNAPRTVFLNRNTGNLTTSLLSPGGIAAIDFGRCEARN